MGLFDFFKKRQSNVMTDTRQVIDPRSINRRYQDNFQRLRIDQNRVRNTTIPNTQASSYQTNVQLIEGYRLWRTDSIIKRQVWIYTSLAVGNGFSIVSEDKEIEQKVNRRLQEIQFNSGTTLELLIRDLMLDFVQTGNQFVALNRKPSASGRQYKINNETLNPTSSMFRLNPAQMSIQRDIYGNVISYKHDTSLIMSNSTFYAANPYTNINVGVVGSKTETQTILSKFDVQHLKFDEDIVTGFGRQFYFEAIDDILLLRKLEGVIEELIQSGRLIQIYYRVGNDKYPAMNQAEIDKVQAMLESEEPYAIKAIPHNHEINIQVADILQDLLQFYDRIRHRVYGVLGIGQVFMGETSEGTKASQGVVADFLLMQVRDIQMQFQSQFQTQILEHIVLDQNYNPKRLGKQMPRLIFNDPSIDILIKKQNQAVFLYEHSQITRSELREMLGMKNIRPDDEDDMYIYRVKIPSQMYTKRSDDGNLNETLNRVMPQNQYTKNEYELGDNEYMIDSRNS